MPTFSFKPKNATDTPQAAPNHDPSVPDLKSAYDHKKTLRTLNAIRIFAPILEALMINPGIAASSDQLSESFQELIKKTSTLSEKTCLMLNLDPNKEQNFWVRNVFEKLFAQLLKNQWIKDNKIDIENIESIMQIMLSYDYKVESQYKASSLPVQEELRLTLVRAILPVLTQGQEGFNLNRNITDDLEHIMSVIMKKTQDNIDQFCDKDLDQKNKTEVFKMLLIESGAIYAGAWKSYSTFAQNYLEKCSPKDKEKYMEKYAKGFPIAKVDAEFEKYFDRLIMLTQKLIPVKDSQKQNAKDTASDSRPKA